MTAVITASLSNKFTQKCVIPINLFETINAKIDEYVTLHTSKKLYVCRIHTTVQPLECVSVDDTVTVNYDNLKQSRENKEILNCIKPIKVLTYHAISVKIVYKSGTCISISDKITYQDVIYKILYCYALGKNCVISCSGLKLADLFNIHSIIIDDAFPEEYSYGRINKNSKVEIVGILSTEQQYQTNEFDNIQLGGLNTIFNILKSNLVMCQSSRVLVTGPSGTGKSSLVKKLCSDSKCFFIFIDGYKNAELSVDKIKVIQMQFSAYQKMFPDRTCILFIDHIDVIAPYNLKPKSSVFMLISMIKYTTNLNVSVIATAVHKSNVNSEVSNLFFREVNVGIPSFQQRKEIIEGFSSSLNLYLDSDEIAQMTPGFVGHDIVTLIKTAVTIKNESLTKPSDILNLTKRDFVEALTTISPSVLKTSVWSMKVKPVYWNDIGGMFGIKQKLQMCVEWPLRHPELFKKVDLPCPHGILLFGPPGCCKTTLARGLATECNANFFAANPAQIYSSYVGESEKNITELFYHARLCAPSIIFLDELDSLVSQRKLDKKSQGVGEKVLSCLLNEMDGFGTKIQFQNNLNMEKIFCHATTGENLDTKLDGEQQSNDVIVVAATNRPDLIDDALLRPGRFDIILYVSPPNEDERESILLTLTRKMLIKDVEMKKIAAETHLFSGADLKSLCNEAAMNALRTDMAASYITEENFYEALKKINPSITKQQIEMYEKLSSKYGTVVK